MSQVSSNNTNSFNVSNHFSLRATDEESKILAWLSPLEPRVRHHDIRAQRVEDVGGWVLQTKEYKSWCSDSGQDQSSHAGLFCYGHPGAGKSFITSLVIDSLCDRARGQNIAVSCFYFDFACRKEQSPINMLGSLLKQLVSGLKEMPDEVAEEYREQQKVIGGRGLEVLGIVRMLQTVSSARRTFICVDAVDECAPEHRFEVLDSLGQILQRSSNTRVFMTGRTHVKGEVERQLDERAASLLITPMEHDIVMYLEARLKKDTTPEIMNTGLKEDIMKSIPEAVSETFLLVSLNIEAILQETTIRHRRIRLNEMLDGLGLVLGLGDAYGATLERIKAQNEARSKLAMRTLMWICYSERPLKVDELCHALAVEIGSTDVDSENVPSIGTLISFCQGLITVDTEASTVRLIHHTLQEYLSSHLDLFLGAHSTIAETCLTHLNSHCVNALSSHPRTNLGDKPFLAYSSLYWGSHARREMTDRVKSLSIELLGQYGNHISAELLLESIGAPQRSNDINGPSQFTGIHCASFFGIVELVAALVKRSDPDTNKRDCVGMTPLTWAAMQGHLVVVELLLGLKGIDPNMPDSDSRTPLWWAATNGHEGVVELLLKQEEVKPDIPDKNSQTPLLCAAANGYEGVVELLFERGEVKPNMPDSHCRTPLLFAALGGHGGVVGLLLRQKGVSPNVQDRTGRTPLSWAAAKGHEGVVKLLLEHKEISPDMPDREGGTPLSWAASREHEGVVKLLLGRPEVSPDMPDKEGGTPLLWAASKGYEGVVKLLLERKEVHPNTPDNNNRTPLLWAAASGHEGVVKLLLEQEKVNPDIADNNSQKPLLWAAANGHEGVVKLLLELE